MIYKFAPTAAFEEFIINNGAQGPFLIRGCTEQEKKYVGPNCEGSIFISESEEELAEFVVARHLDKLGLGELFQFVHFVEYEYENSGENDEVEEGMKDDENLVA